MYFVIRVHGDEHLVRLPDRIGDQPTGILQAPTQSFLLEWIDPVAGELTVYFLPPKSARTLLRAPSMPSREDTTSTTAFRCIRGRSAPPASVRCRRAIGSAYQTRKRHRRPTRRSGTRSRPSLRADLSVDAAYVG